MPRRGKVLRHKTPPDAKFNSVLVQTMINKVMRAGKKSTSERIVYKALDLIAERTKEDPRQVFEQAMRNTMPVLEVRPPPGRWRDLPDSPRSPAGPSDLAGDALDSQRRPRPQRPPHVRATRH